MPNCFLLRFQESLLEDAVFANSAGTNTQTYVRREQPDNDDLNLHYCSIPKVTAGTQTSTRIRKEQTDDDSFNSMRCIPFASTYCVGGTKTVTNVRAETDDSDPSTNVLRAIPRCSSS